MSTLLSEHRQPITAPKLRDRAPMQGSALRTSTRHEPVAAVSGPVVAPRAGWSQVLDVIVATLREWRRRRAGRCELASLDARTLRDIGLDPGVVDYEAHQLFWRPLRDWRD
ncbi:DUF1127 domain-containing protein [Afipia sp. GAS231]|uniref:DUF1127 domain-containing protein n=1 Tax=Afipia sp. GAS231 TaxID=1882747 RepID=UPI00087995EE|nr:DUF1127 domain-containing protein [Afipia sp. GAS231]SDN99284.1 Uncharacterized conserved protein YjiS, DUF1127 family [Afipia sp. GAS231]